MKGHHMNSADNRENKDMGKIENRKNKQVLSKDLWIDEEASWVGWVGFVP